MQRARREAGGSGLEKKRCSRAIVRRVCRGQLGPGCVECRQPPKGIGPRRGRSGQSSLYARPGVPPLGTRPSWPHPFERRAGRPCSQGQSSLLGDSRSVSALPYMIFASARSPGSSSRPAARPAHARDSASRPRRAAGSGVGRNTAMRSPRTARFRSAVTNKRRSRRPGTFRAPAVAQHRHATAPPVYATPPPATRLPAEM